MVIIQQHITDISIPKGSSSGSNPILSKYCESSKSNITTSINGSTLSFFINNGFFSQPNNKGTVTYMNSNSDGSLSPAEMLAITSITAY